MLLCCILGCFHLAAAMNGGGVRSANGVGNQFPIMRLQAFPLPIEGTETSVMADNPEVLSYMVSLSDTLELVCACLLALPLCVDVIA